MNARPSILIVEDNRLLRWWLTSSLYRAGFCALAPETVGDALSCAHSCQFDLLITDWRLPEGHDGFEVLNAVRGTCPRVLSMLISAELDEELTQKAQRAGFDVTFQKPFRLEDIVAAAQKLTESARTSLGEGGPNASLERPDSVGMQALHQPVPGQEVLS